ACASGEVPNANPPNADLMSFGVDSRSALDSRIGDVPADVIKLNEQRKLPPWTNHPLTEQQRKRVSAALRTLTPLQDRVLREHVRSISFVEGMSNNGQTLRILKNDGALHTSFDMVLRAGLLNETISQFATRKERQLFDATGS